MRKDQLILNPVENLPELFHVSLHESIHGLYISDKHKNDTINKASKIAFSGRESYSKMVHEVYSNWAQMLEAKNLSMRLLSGLHAHIVLFMGLGKIGDTVLLLPEEAGGHYATKKILERLGYHVIEMVADHNEYCVNIQETASLIARYEPQLIFVDRSEGIYYEDFSDLLMNRPQNCGAIFDASQYLTNIIMQDFLSPFSMGFDIIMSTLHKNFPGPQKALVCSREDNIYWERIVDAMSSYVSNLHAESILIAGEILSYADVLKNYSKQMLVNSIKLEKALLEYDIPVVQRTADRKATHHIWINLNDCDTAYAFYKKAEECGILFNYRKLPYHLGYGIRMGTAAATLQGINEHNIQNLASFLSEIYHANTVSDCLKERVQQYIHTLSPIQIS